MIVKAKAYLSSAGLGPLLVKAVTGSGVIRVIGMGFGFLVGIQLARGLGPAGYGVYGLVMAFVSIIGVPVEFGVPSLLTREVAANAARSDWGKVRGVLYWAQRTVLRSFALMLALVAAAAWLLSNRIDDKLLIPGLVSILFVPVAASANLRAAALRGLQQLVKGDMPDGLVRPAIYSALLAIASLVVPTGISPTIAIALQIAAVGGSLWFGGHLLKQILPRDFYSYAPVMAAREWRGASFPMAMTQGLRIVQGQLPILVLGWLVSIAEVGLFRAASSMLLVLGMPITLFNVIAGPVAARLHAEGDSVRLQKLLSWSSLGMSVTVFCSSLPIFVAGAPIIRLAFGAQFEGALVPLEILSVGCCLNAMFGAGVVVLNMTGHHACVTRLFVVSLIVLMVLTPPLSWFYGIDGAAVATAASMALFGLLAWLQVRSRLRLDSSVFGAFRVFNRG